MDKQRLEEIRDEIKDLTYEAKDILRHGDKFLYEQARSYWIPHILGALDKDNEYLGGSFVNMQDTIDRLDGGDNNEEDDESNLNKEEANG